MRRITRWSSSLFRRNRTLVFGVLATAAATGLAASLELAAQETPVEQSSDDSGEDLGHRFDHFDENGDFLQPVRLTGIESLAEGEEPATPAETEKPTPGCRTDCPNVFEMYPLDPNALRSALDPMGAQPQMAPQTQTPSAAVASRGQFAGTPDIIGDLLKSGGLVNVRFRPEARVPFGADPRGTLILGDPTRVVYTDTSGNALAPVAGSPFVFFRNSSGTPLIFEDLDGNGLANDLRDLQRVTLDGLGNETSVETNNGNGFDLIGGSSLGAFATATSDQSVVTQSNPAFANVGIVKAAEGSSPIPRDRVFFFYSYFDNVPLGSSSGIHINRYTPGFEKTFWDGRASFEGRFPFAATLNSDFDFTRGPSADDTEFGDILLTVKSILQSGENWVFTGGLQLSVPTADDLSFFFTDTVAATAPGGGVAAVSQTGEFLRIENETVHLLPFVAGAWIPTDRMFVQGFVQLDFDTVGKPVQFNSRPLSAGSSLGQVGVFNDSTFLYADVSVGYWISRDPQESVRWITGVAPLMELHYNRGLTETDQVDIRLTPGATGQTVGQVGRGGEHIELMNATLGCVFEIRHASYLTVGYSTPLFGGSDEEFDGELRVLFSTRFGPGALNILPN